MGAKAKHDLAPLIRGAFERGLGIYCRRKGKTVPEVFAMWLEEDWKAVLNAVGKYTVREQHVTGAIQHDHQHTHEGVSETSRFIESIIGAGEDQSSAEPVQDGSLLSPPVRTQ